MVYVRRIGNIAVQYVPVRANICAVQPNLFACFSCMCDATVRVARCESTCGWSFRILENAKKSSRPGWDTFVASQRNSNSETLSEAWVVLTRRFADTQGAYMEAVTGRVQTKANPL